MVQIIQFPTDEKISDEEFLPKDKYALLVSGRCYDSGLIDNSPLLPRWHPGTLSNLNLYDWEMLMTGTIDFGEISPLNAIDDIVSYSEDDDRITKISRIKPSHLVRLSFSNVLERYKSGKSTSADYKEVIKVWPGSSEVLGEFNAGVERLAGITDDDSLTTIIIFSHGEKGETQIGNIFLKNKKLLQSFDKINGKKVVFIYSCMSGYFLKALRIHPNRRDYAAIASCEAENLSTNWNDKGIDTFLFRHFCEGRRFSDLKLKPINEEFRGKITSPAEHYQCPQMLWYFDVRLV